MFTEPVSSWTMSLKRRASYMLLPAVIWWLGNVPLEHVRARKVARSGFWILTEKCLTFRTTSP